MWATGSEVGEYASVFPEIPLRHDDNGLELGKPEGERHPALPDGESLESRSATRQAPVWAGAHAPVVVLLHLFLFCCEGVTYGISTLF